MHYKEDYVVVVAIELSDQRSGYGLSFKSDKTRFMMNKNWGAGLGFESYKTPTSVLIDDKGDFVAFGHEAEKKLIESQENGGKPAYKLHKDIIKMLDRQQVGAICVET